MHTADTVVVIIAILKTTPRGGGGMCVCACVCVWFRFELHILLLDIACSGWLVTFWLLAGTSVWGARHNLALPPPLHTHIHVCRYTSCPPLFTHTHTQAHLHLNTHVHYIIIMYACTKVITRFSLLPNSPDTIILRFVFRISVCQHASCVWYIPQDGRYAFLVYYGKFKTYT